MIDASTRFTLGVKAKDAKRRKSANGRTDRWGSEKIRYFAQFLTNQLCVRKSHPPKLKICVDVCSSVSVEKVDTLYIHKILDKYTTLS